MGRVMFHKYQQAPEACFSMADGWGLVLSGRAWQRRLCVKHQAPITNQRLVQAQITRHMILQKSRHMNGSRHVIEYPLFYRALLQQRPMKSQRVKEEEQIRTSITNQRLVQAQITFICHMILQKSRHMNKSQIRTSINDMTRPIHMSAHVTLGLNPLGLVLSGRA